MDVSWEKCSMYERELRSSILGAQMDRAEIMKSPHALYRPKIFLDGNKWCALYGENLQDGVAGFGDSPADAMADFDANWFKKLKNTGD